MPSPFIILTLLPVGTRIKWEAGGCEGEERAVPSARTGWLSPSVASRVRQRTEEGRSSRRRSRCRAAARTTRGGHRTGETPSPCQPSGDTTCDDTR